MMMKELINDFPNQLQRALEIAEQCTLSKSENVINNVFISGLGGSGIGGSIVSELVSDNCACPILINKDYFIPSFVNKNTLAIICSYSGNTEETLNVLNLCIEKGAKIIIITSGGIAESIGKKYNIDTIIVPSGFPPRSCIGYSIAQIFNVLEFHTLCNSNYKVSIRNTIKLLNSEKESIKNEALTIAKNLIGKLPIIYTLGNTEGIAIRLRQQINENGKMLCWHHVLPEMNHNELVAWTEINKQLAVIILRYKNDYYRTVKRLEVCKQVFAKYTNTIIEITAHGDNPIEQAFYMIHLGDWISCFIADIKQVDAVDISIITHLKNELSKID